LSKVSRNTSKSNKIVKIVPQGNKAISLQISKGKCEIEFISKLKNFLVSKLLVEPGSRIVLAISGGVDSVSLLDAFYLIRNQLTFTLALAHLNHQLRGKEADEDEEFVKSLAEKYSLPLYIQKFDVRTYAKDNSLSIEEAARNVRYNFLKRVAHSFSAHYIATAHNLNDQAETVLLNIIRGTGLAGLRGIANKLELSKKLFLIRPFLIFTRAEIEQYARERNLSWREDSSNYLLEYSRNKIRHQLIPFLENEFNPQIVPTIGNLASISQNAYKIVSNYVKKYSEKLITVRNKNEIELNLENFGLFDDFIFGDLAQYITNTYFESTLSFKQIEDLKKLINAESGTHILLGKEIFVYKNRRKLCFIRKEKDFKGKSIAKIAKIGHTIWKNYFIEFEEVPLNEFVPCEDRNVEFFDYDKLADVIIVRSWQEGDKFVPLGMKQEKKLSDFFIDEKIPLYKKDEYPIFVSNDQIFWVGKLRISEKFKVTKKTKRVLKGKITDIGKNG
jgi:tRNA(Ile)-lysidine synthase